MKDQFEIYYEIRKAVEDWAEEDWEGTEAGRQHRLAQILTARIRNIVQEAYKEGQESEQRKEKNS